MKMFDFRMDSILYLVDNNSDFILLFSISIQILVVCSALGRCDINFVFEIFTIYIQLE
jgi:hypothetical protein